MKGGIYQLAQWLEGVELLAAELYERCAQLFSNDEPLARFLLQLHQQELGHHQAMVRALEHLRAHPLPETAAVRLDQATKAGIEGSLRTNLKRLRKDSLDREELLDLIVAIEYSECNDLFLYVIEALMPRDRSFADLASLIQTHLQGLEEFLAADPHGKKRLERIQNLPLLWQEQILVVDDEEPVRNLLAAVLGKLGRVDLTADGVQALELISRHYFDLIVSDLEMPEMGGLQLLARLRQDYPQAAEKLIFFSAAISSDLARRLEEQGVGYLRKPASVAEILAAAQQVLPAK